MNTTKPTAKQRIRDLNESLEARFWAANDPATLNGTPGKSQLTVDELVHARASGFDEIICDLWRQIDWPDSASEEVALFAVGGYGRGELHPGSDIDLLILTEGMPEAYASQIEFFVQSLWDLNINIGQSVRSLEDSLRESQRDITVATTLLERRQLSGPKKLDRRIGELFASDEIWPNAKFFKAKRAEQEKRHERHADTEYNLEPNVKSSPGGLRDIQTINWIMKRFFGSATPTDLVSRNFLTLEESQLLEQGRQFLWTLRYGLHLIAKRGEDRLLFEYQRELAQQLGYEDTKAQLAVEQLMHDYYRIVLALREVNELLLQNFDPSENRHPCIADPEKPQQQNLSQSFLLHPL